METRAFLEPLTGIYRYGTVVFRIGIDEAGRLTFTRNEAPTERLLARDGSIFGFAASEFFRIEFRPQRCGPGGRSAIPRTHRHILGRTRRSTSLSSAKFAGGGADPRMVSPGEG